MKTMNLQQMKDQIISMSKLISSLATKDDLSLLEKEI